MYRNNIVYVYIYVYKKNEKNNKILVCNLVSIQQSIYICRYIYILLKFIVYCVCCARAYGYDNLSIINS